MIKFITGTMRSKKSKKLIDEIEEVIKEGAQNYLILKPSTDTRDGAFVKTRVHGRTHPCVMVDERNEQIMNLVLSGLGLYDTIFIDEVQFFSAEFIKVLSKTCEALGVDIVASGLMKDFKGDFFPSSYYLWLWTNPRNVTYLFGECFSCNEQNASIDVLMTEANDIVTDGESVHIEGSDHKHHFESLCDDCYQDMTND